jgi:hypothetical protein
MKSNKAAKSTTYPSSQAKAKSALQAIPTAMPELLLPLKRVLWGTENYFQVSQRFIC